MPEATPILVPLDNVNDEIVKLVSWQVKEGQDVQEGQSIAEVETSKALVELIAPLTGKVWPRVAAGLDVPVGAVVGFITVNGAAPPLWKESEASNDPTTYGSGQIPKANGTGTVLPSGTSFSKRALELLRQNHISPDLFSGRGMVREHDVLKHLAKKPSADAAFSGLHIALKGLSLEQVTLPDGFAHFEKGTVDSNFLSELRNNSESFGRLASEEKCALYRQHGAIIGDRVALGPGTLVIAPQIVIGEEAQLAENSSIVCRERFIVGRLTSFRSSLTVRGGTVVLGANIFAGRNVQIGGGGNSDPWSLLSIGDDTYVGDDVFINICRPVVIGREVFLTQRSVLVTHNIGHSVLEGYENKFAPIVLEDFSQIGMNCTVYAGTCVGRSAIVASNSYVISSIPPGKLAIGVPAKVVRAAARPPDRKRQVQIVQSMVREYRELLSLKGHQVGPLETDPLYRFSLEHSGKRFQLVFLESFAASSSAIESADENIVWSLDSVTDAEPKGIYLMDLLSKQISGTAGIFANSTREFLRKRGLRFKPGPWRYRSGLI